MNVDLAAAGHVRKLYFFVIAHLEPGNTNLQLPGTRPFFGQTPARVSKDACQTSIQKPAQVYFLTLNLHRMKKHLFILPGLSLLLLVFNCDVYRKSGSQTGFELKRVGNDFAAFHYNAQGKVQEFFLVQGSDWNIAETSVTQAVYNESIDLQLTGSNGTRYIFSLRAPAGVQGSIHTFSVAGIAHVKTLKPEGLALKDMETIAFARIGGSPGSVSPDCDKKCLSGGCGANQCSRQMGGAMECNVSCNSGYFACCGDLISYGCHCIKDTCCK